VRSKYKVYPGYIDIDVEWLERIPEHWGLRKFNYLFQIKKRIAKKLGFDVLSITQHGIKIKDIESGDGQLSSDYSKYQHVEKNDFAMNHMDLLTGFVDLSKFNGVTSPDYRVFTLIDSNSNIYYYLYLLQIGYKNKIFFPFGQGASQRGRWRLPSGEFKKFTAPLPPLKEQEQIASYIGIAVEKIDALIKNKEKLVDLLKERRQTIVYKIIHKQGVLKQRLEYVVEKKLRPVTRDPDVEYEALGVYNQGRGLFHKPLKSEQELGASDFYWVQEGDLILSGQFAWEGSIALAKKNEQNCIVSHRYPIIQGKKNVIDTEYLWAYFTTQAGGLILNEHSVGSAGRNRPLNINTLLKEKIPVPLITEQRKVANMVKVEQNIKILIEKSIALLKEKRIALINAAVTGKIDVREAA